MRSYELLNVLEFDSTRKRMSVIVKNLETNVYSVYCKGITNYNSTVVFVKM